MSFIEELKWRGMVQDIIPGTEELLEKEITTGYIGFDPTAESLHIGSLVPILLLVHLQRAGHKPLALIGGATGMIGDPSGKSEERNLLDETTLQKNVEGIKKQLEKYLDFNSENSSVAELVNNYDWFKDFTFIHFLRDVGKHITINYMMAKESVKKRVESDSGISYTEFAYQLMQGYDFLWLYKNKNCKLQMGGSDQWGNITTGSELIRKKIGQDAFAFTCPLIKKADGGKFGKTEKGNIWLDPEKTSPYLFYQFWLNSSDEDAGKWLRIFTFLSKEDILETEELHRNNQSNRTLQKKLAEEVTRFVHGEEGLLSAIETTKRLFEQVEKPVEEMSLEDLQSLEGIERINFQLSQLKQGLDLISFLSETRIFPSKGEARKMVSGGGVRINRIKVVSDALMIEEHMLLHKKYLLVQKGKKNHFLVEII
jgi:tyrosyl-tRNA synthetase